MNTFNRTLIASACALGLSAGAAIAGDDWNEEPSYHGVETTESVTFEELDRNGDGFIYREDVPADHELAALFAQYDLDGDGRLNRDEFAMYAGEDDTDSEPAE
ncbi:MAG: EF-hand domain-containing protein [Lysobacteraceae bacterium]